MGLFLPSSITHHVIPCFLVLLIATISTGENTQLSAKTEAREIPFMLVPDLIRYWGYGVEEHWVTSEDGYIQGVQRIISKKHNNQEPRPAVFMMHCLVCSSAIWVFGPPQKSLGFMLADLGYDVWMGNARGNTYSRNHTHLDPDNDKEEFWDFGWHDTALYDITSAIDHILEATGEEKVLYVGHSMGCTEFLATMSMKPEYNDKVTAAVLLAPPAYMDHATNPMFLMAHFGNIVDWLVHLIGMYEFLPNDFLLSFLGHAACNDDHPLLEWACANFAYLFLGMHADNMNQTMMSVYLDHLPEGTSTRPFLHYAQLFLSEKFESYDFGEEGNLEHYGTTGYPDYDLAKITVPTALFYGTGDDLADPIDVHTLSLALPNCFLNHEVEFDGFSHGEFFAHTDADKLVYKYVIDIFQEYAPVRN